MLLHLALSFRNDSEKGQFVCSTVTSKDMLSPGVDVVMLTTAFMG